MNAAGQTDQPLHVRAVGPLPDETLRCFSHNAMGTTFEILVAGHTAEYARQASIAAFEELDRLDGQLSRFIPSSDIAQINALPVGGSVRIGAAALECLELAAQLREQTTGAFDVTLGRPEHLRVDRASFAATVEGRGLAVDLGGIGKGYAVDRMAELLGEWGIETALIHSGQSTALPVGPSAWELELRHPVRDNESLSVIRLQHRALSGSGTALRGEHIIDPRTGRPVGEATGAWAAAPTAAISDALSTAFMIMTPDDVAAYCRAHSGISAILVRGTAGVNVMRFGEWE